MLGVKIVKSRGTQNSAVQLSPGGTYNKMSSATYQMLGKSKKGRQRWSGLIANEVFLFRTFL